MIHPARPLALSLGLALLLSSCASSRLEKQLDPKSRDFISKVRYIITPGERRAFLALPMGDREAFVEDFWKRRDPTPKTEENEYKKDYFNRIETANHLFSGGGAPGWLQDRGRVFITLGPPDHREAYPRGVTFYGLPTEIWWYGFFPITFIDERWVDDYRLDPDGATQIAVINRAQVDWNQPREGLSRFGATRYTAALPELEVKVEKAEVEGGGAGARFTLTLPYKYIWLKSHGERFEATLEVTMKVADAAGAEVWTFAKAFPLDIPQSRLKEVLAQDFTAEAIAALAPGSYTLSVTVTNTTDGSRATLERKFDF
jgi:GWxTD domain-containing protein